MKLYYWNTDHADVVIYADSLKTARINAFYNKKLDDEARKYIQSNNPYVIKHTTVIIIPDEEVE